MKASLLILAVFLLGAVIGRVGLLPDALPTSAITVYVLYLLILLVAVAIGGSGKMLTVIRKVHVKVVLVPMGVMAGTLLAVAGVSTFLPTLGVRQSLAVGSGFGYYSLSSVIITSVSGKTLGAVALLSNILREIAAIVLTPLLVRYLGKLMPIGLAGAPAMDTALPVITRFSGKEYAMIAAFSGFVLTVAVPFLVTFILTV